MSDQELCTKIRQRLALLCEAINDALNVGLEVHCTLDASDKYYPPGAEKGAIRQRDVRITRTF